MLLNIVDNCTNATNNMMGDVLPPSLRHMNDPHWNGMYVMKSVQQIETERLEELEMQSAMRRLNYVAATATATGTGVTISNQQEDTNHNSNINDTTGMNNKKRKLDESVPVPLDETIATTTTMIKTEGNESQSTASRTISVSTTESKSTSGIVSTSTTKNQYPAWFHLDKISIIEMRYLPEFFHNTGKNIPSQVTTITQPEVYMLQKTPLSYKQIRNFIIQQSNRLSNATSSITANNLTSSGVSYNANYLSATDCRKLICGDVCSILRIHEFLDVFGIINQHVPIEFKPFAYSIGSGGSAGTSTGHSASSNIISSSPMIANSLKYACNDTVPQMS